MLPHVLNGFGLFLRKMISAADFYSLCCFDIISVRLYLPFKIRALEAKLKGFKKVPTLFPNEYKSKQTLCSIVFLLCRVRLGAAVHLTLMNPPALHLLTSPPLERSSWPPTLLD